MTQSLQKQEIQPSWSTEEIQQHLVKMIGGKMQTKMELLEKGKLQNLEEFRKASVRHKAECMKNDGIKTPLDLVKKLAELEVNLTGSKASVEGDENSATLINEEPKVFFELKEKLNEGQLDKAREFFSTWMTELGSELGFKCRVDLAPEGSGTKITFSKS